MEGRLKRGEQRMIVDVLDEPRNDTYTTNLDVKVRLEIGRYELRSSGSSFGFLAEDAQWRVSVTLLACRMTAMHCTFDTVQVQGYDGFLRLPRIGTGSRSQTRSAVVVLC